jgi:hypothetical protein
MSTMKKADTSVDLSAPCDHVAEATIRDVARYLEATHVPRCQKE